MDAIAKTRFGVDVAKLKAIATALSKQSTEAVIKLNDNGLETRVVNPWHTALYQVLMAPEDFYEYEVEDEVSSTVNVEEILKVLKQMKKSDCLYMDIYSEPTEENPDKLIVELVVENERRTKKYSFLDETTKEYRHNKWLKVPNLTLKRFVKMNAKDLYNAIKEAFDVSDSFVLTVTTDNPPHVVIDDGSDVEGAGKHVQIDSIAEPLDGDDGETKVMATFPIEETLSIKPLTDVYKEVEIYANKDWPLELVFKDEHDKVLYMVAPKINE